MNFGAVTQAIRARLAGYSALASNVTYIGTDKPQDADPADLSAFPYCVIEPVSAVPFDTKDNDGGNELVQVTTFCRPTETKSATALADELAQAAYDALHKYDLTVSGSNAFNCLFDSSPGNLPDPDGVTRYRPMTFRVVYEGA